MVGRRHASEEIAAKLAQADELAAKGKTRREISKALGVSIMTYHRWRKQGVPAAAASDDGNRRPQFLPDHVHAANELGRLELENSRLRRLVTDLLLEKVRLEEELRSRNEARVRRAR